MGEGIYVRLTLSIACLAIVLAPAIADATDATIPIEVLAVDPAIAEGEILIGTNQWALAPPAIAMQPARIARGAVIENSAGRPKVLALALMGSPEKDANGAARLDGSRDLQAWCELPTSLFVTSWQQYVVDCYQDQNGDGAFEVQYSGHLHGEVAIMLASVDSPKSIKPLPFRAAETAELPLLEVGYASCGTASQQDASQVKDIQFGTYIRFAKGGKSTPRICKHVATPLDSPTAGEKLFQVGRFKVAVRETDGVLTSRLVEGIPAGTLLGNLRFDRPLLDITAPADMTDLEATDKEPLYLAAMPQITATAAAGETFLKAQVAHGITGKLRTEVSRRGWAKAVVIPAGSPVFGTPMSGSLGERAIDTSIVWCTPWRNGKKLVSQCFVPTPYSIALVENPRPFSVAHLNDTPYGVDPPIVDRAEVDFGQPIFLQVRYIAANPRFIVVETSVSYLKEPVWHRLYLRRKADGSGMLGSGGAIVILRPAADKKSFAIETVGDFEIGAGVGPLDVAEMMGN